MTILWASPVAQMVKNLPAIQETEAQFLGQEEPLEEELATHFSILACRIPWTEKPGGLQFLGLQRVGHDWETNIFSFTFFFKIEITMRKEWNIVHAKSLQLCPSLCNAIGCLLPASPVCGILQARNTGVGCHVPLQGIFPTQGLNLGLLHYRQILYHLNH